MKNYLLILLALICISSCGDPETQDGIDGSWKLTSTSGTITGQGIIADWDKVVVNNDKFTFYKDTKSIENGQLTYVHDATKDLHKVTFVFDNKTAVVGDLKNDPIKTYEINGNKLSLISDCCDRVNYELTKD
jgi:uncharacterized protein YlaI